MVCNCIGYLRVTGELLLVAMIAGCNSPASVPEKSASSGKASGNSAADSAVAGQPASAAIPAVPPVPAEAVDTRHLAKVLDLGKLPPPDGAKVTEQLSTKLEVTVPLKVPEAVEFYMAKLKPLGWQQVGNPASSTITDSFAQVSIGKGGYQLTLTAMQGKPNEASVTISQLWQPGYTICCRAWIRPRINIVALLVRSISPP